MRTTNYIHVNSEKKVNMSVNTLNSTGNMSVNIDGGLSDLSLFMTPEQLIQLNSVLGLYISENPDKFVTKEMIKLTAEPFDSVICKKCGREVFLVSDEGLCFECDKEENKL